MHTSDVGCIITTKEIPIDSKLLNSNDLDPIKKQAAIYLSTYLKRLTREYNFENSELQSVSDELVKMLLNTDVDFQNKVYL